MDKFPELIRIKLIREGVNLPIPNIAIQVRLFANHKNDYNFIPSVSDKEGVIEITKDWLISEIDKDRNLFIMDYATDIDDCKPLIKITVMNNSEIQKAVNGLKLYKKVLNISDKEIELLSQADNYMYESLYKIVEFNNDKEITINLILNPVKK